MLKSDLPPHSPWRMWRRARRIGFALWLGYLPGVVVIGFPASQALGSEIAYLGVALLWMAAVMLFNYWTGSFRCPRCHQPFYRQWWYQGSYARRCVHCGLPRWADFEHE